MKTDATGDIVLSRFRFIVLLGLFAAWTANADLVIDVQGVEDLRESAVEALYVFVDAPSFEELERRLRERRAA